MQPATKWTEEQDVMLKDLIETQSFNLIAAAINAKFGTAYSRNAVIGRAHRLVLPKPQPQISLVTRRVESRAKLGVGPMVQKIRRGRFGKAPEIKAEPIIPRAADIVSLRKPLLDLRAMECRWADEDRNAVGLHTFCGHPTADGHSYCPAHRYLAIDQARMTKIRAARGNQARAAA